MLQRRGMRPRGRSRWSAGWPAAAGPGRAAGRLKGVAVHVSCHCSVCSDPAVAQPLLRCAIRSTKQSNWLPADAVYQAARMRGKSTIDVDGPCNVCCALLSSFSAGLHPRSRERKSLQRVGTGCVHCTAARSQVTASKVIVVDVLCICEWQSAAQHQVAGRGSRWEARMAGLVQAMLPAPICMRTHSLPAAARLSSGSMQLRRTQWVRHCLVGCLTNICWTQLPRPAAAEVLHVRPSISCRHH